MNTVFVTSSAESVHASSPQWASCERDAAAIVETRVLIIPGLRDSGEAHWQTWLQRQYQGALRVQQADWHRPDLAQWSQRVQTTAVAPRRPVQWVAVAHSFGCLALAHHLARQAAQDQAESAGLGWEEDAPGAGRRHGRIVAALMVAPADPIKFGVVDQLPQAALDIPLTVIGSENDPWMPLARAHEWARRWGAGFVNLGEVGHINTESGFGPWPLARKKVDHLVRAQRRTVPCACSLAG